MYFIQSIQNIIQAGKSVGMQMMDQAIAEYYREGRVSGEEAYLKAQDKQPYEEFAPS